METDAETVAEDILPDPVDPKIQKLLSKCTELDESQWASEKQFTVNIKGEAIDVPIYAENPILDFQCCLIGKFYRSFVELKNRYQTAMQVWFQIIWIL